MEPLNRFGQQHSTLRNAYVAYASTGKAADNLNDTKVHSAFRMTAQGKKVGNLSREVQQQYRCQFSGVKYVIIDEISMIGFNLFHRIYQGCTKSPACMIVHSGDYTRSPAVISGPP